MNFTDKDVQEKIESYSDKKIKFISKEIEKKFIIDNDNFQENLAIISLLIDEKLKINRISDIQKNLIVETTFSAYEYLNNSMNIDIDSFLLKVNENLNTIKMSNLNNSINEVYSFYNQVLINKNILDLSTNSLDKKHVISYTHELMHCLSNDRQNKTNGLINCEFTFLNSAFSKEYNKVLYFNEMQTEYIAQQVLVENFPEQVIYDIDFNKEFKDGEILEFKAKSYNYYEIETYAESINYMYGDALKNIYFLRDGNINVFEKPLIDKFNDFSKAYKESYFSKNFEDFFKLEESFKDIVDYYIKTNNISNEEYFKLTEKLLENPRTLSNHKLNLNELLVARLDVERFYENLKDISINEIKDILIDINSPKNIKDFKMDAVDYFDYESNKSELYHFLKDIKDIRIDEVSVNQLKKEHIINNEL